MTISEQSRHAMYVQLESVLGQEAALILMEHLPPVGWADVATKRDLDQLHVLIQRDLAVGMGELRSEMSQLRADVFDRMAAQSSTQAVGMGELRSEISAQTRTMVFSMIGLVVSVAALTLTAAQIT